MPTKVPALYAINHLLQGEAWARDRLKPFAGKRVVFRAPPLPDLKLVVTAEGTVAAATGEDAMELTLTIKPGALPHLLSGSDALLQHVDISGNADLASTVQFLFRNLKWDAEEDLSRRCDAPGSTPGAAGKKPLIGWKPAPDGAFVSGRASRLTFALLTLASAATSPAGVL
ncbi:MAG: SCP2 sterol-binding domain-containing protein [Proteobacteria bacterium]|nr:SCP2 sterol-binding domain-containing protein [Pseudomonadota bacterium]